MSIKDLRALSGMTQKAFADYFGIPYRTVQDWDAGRRKCPDYLADLMAFKLQKEGMIKAGE